MYYKICYQLEDDIPRSIWALGNYEVVYNLLDWTEPRIGKLFVFDSLTAALHYYRSMQTNVSSAAIYTCDVKDPEPLDLIPASSVGYESFWGGNYTGRLNRCPSGTVGVSAVMLNTLLLRIVEHRVVTSQLQSFVTGCILG